MMLDEVDIKILKIFYNLKEDEYTGTRLITKYIFPDLSKGALRAKEKTIDYRIRRMSPNLINVEKKDNGYYEYTLIPGKVKFCKHIFSRTQKNCLIIKENGKDIIFEI